MWGIMCNYILYGIISCKIRTLYKYDSSWRIRKKCSCRFWTEYASGLTVRSGQTHIYTQTHTSAHSRSAGQGSFIDTSHRLIFLPGLGGGGEPWRRVMTVSDGSWTSNPPPPPGERGELDSPRLRCPLSSFMSLVSPLCLSQASGHNRTGSMRADNVTQHWQLLINDWTCSRGRSSPVDITGRVNKCQHSALILHRLIDWKLTGMLKVTCCLIGDKWTTGSSFIIKYSVHSHVTLPGLAITVFKSGSFCYNLLSIHCEVL